MILDAAYFYSTILALNHAIAAALFGGGHRLVGAVERLCVAFAVHSGNRADQQHDAPAAAGPRGSREPVEIAERDDDTGAIIDELKSMLGLDPDHSSFRVTERVIGRKPDEITVRVRSLLTLMGFLSRGIEIPASHIEEKRVEEMISPVDPELRSLLFPLRIHSSVERPADAFVAVRHHDHWFYITHSDHMSKQAFSLLTYLFQMQAPQAQTLGPMITVPTSQ